MAIFHLSIQVISRGKGKSAVAAAAYRAGEKLTNEYEGDTYDYTHKGGVIHTEILLPEHAPREFLDRSTLWNAVEKSEVAKNSQLAREMNLAFPYELTAEQNLSLVRRYVRENFVNAGMCADVCIHEPDHDTPNPHAHIMLTMRPLNLDGSWGAKCRKEYMLDENGEKIRLPSGEFKSYKVRAVDWNDRDKAEEWRAAWAAAVNEELKRVGSSERIDHRSYERQGINQIPTIHMGVAASQMERKGIHTERGDINREIAVTNSQLKQLRARINKTKTWLDEKRNDTPPSLYETLSAILKNENRSAIANLKLAAKTLVFIQENHISDLGTLADKVGAMQHDYNDVYAQIKNVEKRANTLDKHLEHSANFKKYRGVMAQYKKLTADVDVAKKATGLFAKSKVEKARAAAQDFYETHDSEITIFRAAEKYLKGVLQKRFDPQKLPPITALQKEREDCKSELGGLYSKYHSLKSDVQDAETIKRFAANLMVPDEPREPQTKTKTWEVEI
jgi:hypothetical protein